MTDDEIVDAVEWEVLGILKREIRLVLFKDDGAELSRIKEGNLEHCSKLIAAAARPLIARQAEERLLEEMQKATDEMSKAGFRQKSPATVWQAMLDAFKAEREGKS